MTGEVAVKILDKVALVAGIAAIGIAQWLGGLWAGYAYGGSVLCDYVYPPVEPGKIRFSISGGGNPPYSDLSDLILYFAFWLFLFSATKLFHNNLVRSFALAPLVLVTLIALEMRRVIGVHVNADSAYIELLRLNLSELYLVFGLTAAIVGIQIIAIAITILSKRKQRRA